MHLIAAHLSHLPGLFADGAEYKCKPDMMETSKSEPAVYAKFVRFVALRQLLRQDEIDRLQSVVTWE
jgi:hypothetical protein